jgi:hypothetical protein
MSILEAARAYLARSWMVIPIPHRSKKPILSGWQKLRLAEADLPQYFTGSENIGLLLGETSLGLVDVDLDAPEAVSLAEIFIPPTGRIHGRPGKPRSHYWYMAEPIPGYMKYQDTDGICLVELRSTGQQTIVPPSVHPTGEILAWAENGEPAHVNDKVLLRQVGRLASCALLARHWPATGSRQDLALALAGTLLRATWGESEAAQFIDAAARIAGDEECAKRAQALSNTTRRLKDKQPATGTPTLMEILDEKVTNKLIEWLELHAQNSGPEGVSARSEKERSPSAAETLLGLVVGMEFFHTAQDECFVTFEVNGHSETWPLNSTRFKQWLTRVFFLSQKKPPNDQALSDTIRVLEAEARFVGPERPIFLRVAQHDGAIYLDLGNADWEAVEISLGGWAVISDPPVRFRRTQGMQPLPKPQRGGSVQILRPFVNVADDDNFRLLLAWLLAALRPSGPYPILVLQGEQGSAKSTTARVLRAMIDPSTIPLRSLPREERDLMIAAQNTWVPVFDNLSGLSATTSDVLCRLASGGGFATRALYSNDAESLLTVQRPVMLNGIDDLATRHDLIDRTLAIPLPPIPETGRRDEETFWREFKSEQPCILGALLDVLVEALYRYPNVKLFNPPRMADFARFSTAAELALGWERGGFLAAYAGNRRESVEAGLDAHALAPAIRALIDQQSAWTGTASELLTTLIALAEPRAVDSRFWPKTAAQLGKQLKRLTPALRAIGIECANNRDGHGRERLITLRQILDSPVRTVRNTDTDEKPQDQPHIPGTATQTDADGRRTGSEVDVRVLSSLCPPTTNETGVADGADSTDSRMPESPGITETVELGTTVSANSKTEAVHPIPVGLLDLKDAVP